MENNNVDIIGSLTLFTLIYTSLAYVFGQHSDKLLLVPTVLVLLIIMLYIYRVRQLPLENRNPLGDTIISLSGLSIALYMSSFYLINKSYYIGYVFAQFKPIYSVSLLIAGIFLRIFIIDIYLQYLWSSIINIFNGVLLWIKSSKVNLFRLILLSFGVTLIIISEVYDIDYLIAAGFLLLTITSLITAYINWDDKSISKKFAYFLITLTISEFHNQYINLELITLYIFVISILSITFVNKITYNLLKNFFRFISKNKMLTLRVSGTVISLILFLIKFNLGIFGFSLNNFIAAIIVLLLAYSYGIYRFIKKIFPYIKVIFAMKYFLFISGVVLYIWGINISSNYLSLPILLLSSLLFSLSFNYIIMRIYDKILNVVSKFFVSILKLISIKRLISTAGLIMMFMGLFIPINTQYNDFIIRSGLFIIGAIFYIGIYEHRRKGFVKVIMPITRFIYHNIIILTFWSVALFLSILAFGLIFPGSVTLSSLIFQNIINNRQISIIIAIVLIGVAIMALVESMKNREKYKVEG